MNRDRACQASHGQGPAGPAGYRPSQTILVTGPARSGKSAWAERLAHDSGRPVVYLATAREDPYDPEWQARIAAHRSRRPAHWQTCCEPVDLAAAIRAAGEVCLLVDSLGIWVANLLDLDESAWSERVEELLAVFDQSSADPLILVAEECGWGVIPPYPSGRLFRDRLGELIQRIGPRCCTVWLVTGGHALDLKRLGVPLDLPGHGLPGP